MSDEDKCPACKGTKSRHVEADGYSGEAMCPDCGGTGMASIAIARARNEARQTALSEAAGIIGDLRYLLAGSQRLLGEATARADKAEKAAKEAEGAWAEVVMAADEGRLAANLRATTAEQGAAEVRKKALLEAARLMGDKGEADICCGICQAGATAFLRRMVEESKGQFDGRGFVEHRRGLAQLRPGHRHPCGRGLLCRLDLGAVEGLTMAATEPNGGGWIRVTPVVDPKAIRSLCVRPYAGHPQGCPNHGHRPTCPPCAPTLDKLLDLSGPVFAVYNMFDLAEHAARMRARHPEWSERQVYCCLYWQPRARKQLEGRVDEFCLNLGINMGLWRIVRTPEGAGCNVTRTMHNVGIKLEWPPRKVAYQIALAGRPL